MKERREKQAGKESYLLREGGKEVGRKDKNEGVTVFLPAASAVGLTGFTTPLLLKKGLLSSPGLHPSIQRGGRLWQEQNWNKGRTDRETEAREDEKSSDHTKRYVDI